MDTQERRRALRTLQRVYEQMAERALETVIENEEGLDQSPYSFAYQEIEDRYALRLINLGHMIGALQQLERPREVRRVSYRVERVEGALDELDDLINERLMEFPSDTLHDMQLAQEEPGNWHAFLTLSRPA
jgi:hypothetical protein